MKGKYLLTMTMVALMIVAWCTRSKASIHQFCFTQIYGEHPAMNRCAIGEVMTGIYQPGEILCSRIDVECTRP